MKKISTIDKILKKKYKFIYIYIIRVINRP